MKAESRHLYFIQAVDGGPIKIGRAASVEKRLRELQASSPVALRVLAVGWDHGLHMESTLHRDLVAHRLHGEWFSPTPEVLQWVEFYRQAGWKRADRLRFAALPENGLVGWRVRRGQVAA